MSAEKKYIPLAKQSKREKRKFYAARRGDWQGLSPVTRVAPDRKSYDRNRRKDQERKARGEDGQE